MVEWSGIVTEMWMVMSVDCYMELDLLRRGYQCAYNLCTSCNSIGFLRKTGHFYDLNYVCGAENENDSLHLEDEAASFRDPWHNHAFRVILFHYYSVPSTDRNILSLFYCTSMPGYFLYKQQ